MNSRRAVLGGVGAVALAALGYRAWDRGVFESGDGGAYWPWRDWQGHVGDGIRRPLHAAILAANPHDTQPWLFAGGGNTIEVIADRARNLGAFDPFRREMHLGLGCAVENLALAAQAFGYAIDVLPVNGRLAPNPGAAPAPAVQLALNATAPNANALFSAIPLRHTNRGPYHGDLPIPANVLATFQNAVNSNDVRLVLITDRIARAEFTALEVEATRHIIDDPEMSADSARWFRTGKREIDLHRDGITLEASGLSPLMVMGAKMLPDQDAHTADRYWLDMTREVHAGTAPLFGMILVRDRLDMASAISAGRAWQRLHLLATLNGVAAQPMNQPVEMVDRNATTGRPDNFAQALRHFSHIPDWEPTFLFRMGYPQWPAAPSPRRPLHDVMLAMS